MPGARARAERGELAFGTVDCFLLWQLTGGRVHATDATNASRTLLFDIRTGAWDDELLALFRVPRALLPEVRDCAGEFGRTDAARRRRSPICGIAGDQQAATVGQACFEPGMVKATYGTGCFMLLNTGETPGRLAQPPADHDRLSARRQAAPTRWKARSSSPAPRCNGCATGSACSSDAAETGPLAARADPEQAVFLVPAFTGLGAPHWDPEARGALFGLTRNTGPAELARAALESVAYQTRDLIEAMQADAPGAARRPCCASMAAWSRRTGRCASSPTRSPPPSIARPCWRRPRSAPPISPAMPPGLCPEPAEFADQWRLDRRFTPTMAEAERARRYAAWRDAVRRTLTPRR